MFGLCCAPGVRSISTLVDLVLLGPSTLASLDARGLYLRRPPNRCLVVASCLQQAFSLASPHPPALHCLTDSGPVRTPGLTKTTLKACTVASPSLLLLEPPQSTSRHVRRLHPLGVLPPPKSSHPDRAPYATVPRGLPETASSRPIRGMTSFARGRQSPQFSPSPPLRVSRPLMPPSLLPPFLAAPDMEIHEQKRQLSECVRSWPPWPSSRFTYSSSTTTPTASSPILSRRETPLRPRPLI